MKRKGDAVGQGPTGSIGGAREGHRLTPWEGHGSTRNNKCLGVNGSRLFLSLGRSRHRAGVELFVSRRGCMRPQRGSGAKGKGRTTQTQDRRPRAIERSHLSVD